MSRDLLNNYLLGRSQYVDPDQTKSDHWHISWKLKIETIIPIFKKGDVNFKTIIDQYHNSLNTLSKVFERVIYNPLYSYLNTHDIITNCQYGFRRHHSTELTEIEPITRTSSERDQYKISVNIYIDLSKAFDLNELTILLHELSHYDIHDTALKLLKSYLIDRIRLL